MLIDAACRDPLASQRDVVFVLAGDDQGRSRYRLQLQDQIEDLGAGSRIRLVGHCDDVPAALALSDVSVVASTLPEAFGRAAVEAQALGVPVVVTRLGAASETVLAPPEADERTRTGWLVPAGDDIALAGAIDQALSLQPSQVEFAGGTGAHQGGTLFLEVHDGADTGALSFIGRDLNPGS